MVTVKTNKCLECGHSWAAHYPKCGALDAAGDTCDCQSFRRSEMKPIPMVVGYTGDEAPLSCDGRVDELKQKLQEKNREIQSLRDIINTFQAIRRRVQMGVETDYSEVADMIDAFRRRGE